MTVEILDLYDKRRVLRKIRFELEGTEKYEEVNNNTKRCMKKAKENWTGEQCSETEENLKNNSKRAYKLVKDLTTVKQGKATTIQDCSGKCLTDGLSQSHALSLPPASNIQLTQDRMNYLFFCFFVVCSLKKETSSKICTFCSVLSN